MIDWRKVLKETQKSVNGNFAYITFFVVNATVFFLFLNFRIHRQKLILPRNFVRCNFVLFLFWFAYTVAIIFTKTSQKYELIFFLYFEEYTIGIRVVIAIEVCNSKKSLALFLKQSGVGVCVYVCLYVLSRRTTLFSLNVHYSCWFFFMDFILHDRFHSNAMGPIIAIDACCLDYYRC